VREDTQSVDDPELLPGSTAPLSVIFG
jgi:hypothetical protein